VARIVASTRCFVVQPKLPVWFRTFDTVAIETPASFAISLMVVTRIGLGFIWPRPFPVMEALPFKVQKVPHRCTMSMKKTELVFVDAGLTTRRPRCQIGGVQLSSAEGRARRMAREAAVRFGSNPYSRTTRITAERVSGV
jgi:hypothetical protein